MNNGHSMMWFLYLVCCDGFLEQAAAVLIPLAAIKMAGRLRSPELESSPRNLPPNEVNRMVEDHLEAL